MNTMIAPLPKRIEPGEDGRGGGFVVDHSALSPEEQNQIIEANLAADRILISLREGFEQKFRQTGRGYNR